MPSIMNGLLLELRRGRGTTVTGTPERGVVFERALDLIRFAKKRGYGVDELIEIIRVAGP